MRSYIAAGFALGLAGTAQAASLPGWYVGAEGGIGQLGDSAGTGYDYGLALMGLAGYGFKPLEALQFKLEGELGWRDNGVDTLNGTAGSGETQSLSMMANFMGEFMPAGRFHPFLGAGIGGARVEASGSANGQNSYSGNDTVFAYQALAGIGYDLGTGLGLKVAYRYFATEDPSIADSAGAAVEREYSSHAVTAGLTFRFGGPVDPAPVEKAAEPAPRPAPVVARAVEAPAAQPAQAERQFRVFFDWDSAEVTPAAEREIRRAAQVARAGQQTRIDLVGHADSSGPETYNLRLSLERAKAVKEILLKEGLSPALIGVAGKGEKELMIPTRNGVREPQNRRVEIILP